MAHYKERQESEHGERVEHPHAVVVFCLKLIGVLRQELLGRRANGGGVVGATLMRVAGVGPVLASECERYLLRTVSTIVFERTRG